MSRLSTQAAAAMGAGRARARASKGPTAHQPAKTSATGTGDGLDIFAVGRGKDHCENPDGRHG